jgi:transcriptional regulator with XRE-family HTH domain
MTPVVSLTDKHERLVKIAVGKKLLHAMTAAGYSYDDLAGALGISTQVVARIVNGTSTITGPQLIWAAKVLDVPVENLCP